jgi:cyclopropane fatty-acyl-phospholipid synthase-like methyltransferase
MPADQYKRFADLSYADFRELAKDASLSKYEKIGFPNAYREGKEAAIFVDIKSKLSLLSEEGKVILDIGTGCSDLPQMLIEQCEANTHQLLLVDSEEMLALLPSATFIKKYPGMYPSAIYDFNQLKGKVDVILLYSVLHYIFVEGNIYSFLDKSLSLLSPGGQMLIGDIPNSSKRKRFFSSETGMRFHQEFTKTKELPKMRFLKIEDGQIDDVVIMGLVNRARSQGFDAYVLPQRPELPMANRREDILIMRP